MTKPKTTTKIATWKTLSDLPDYIPVNVPDGISGPWEVYSFEVSEEAERFGAMRAMFSTSDRGRYVPKGTYKGIKRNNQIIMSNTPNEVRDTYNFLREAKGNILINGLGLGIVLDIILNKVTEDNKPAVSSVIVVEISEDVIKLVGPTFNSDPRVTIVNHDALTYRTKDHFDAVYNDIWDNITSDNLKTMKTLTRKYGRKSDWIGSWCQSRCEYYARHSSLY
jgi:hypothetical protein